MGLGLESIPLIVFGIPLWNSNPIEQNVKWIIICNIHAQDNVIHIHSGVAFVDYYYYYLLIQKLM